MERSVYSLPLDNLNDRFLVLDATGDFGDGIEWTLRDQKDNIVHTLNVDQAIELAGLESNWVVETTLVVADILEAQAQRMAISCGGMDDNIRDLWQTGISLHAQVESLRRS